MDGDATTTTADPGAGTTTAQPSWTAGILDTATPGALVADWHTKAPEPGKWEPYKGAKTLEELLGTAEKRVNDAQTALRTRPAAGPARPAADAAPEAWKAYREANGLPDKPEDYGLARPADFPEQLWSDAEAADFMKFAHDNDLKPDTVKAIATWQQERARNAFADSQRQEAEAFTKLQADENAAMTKAFGARLDGTLKDLQAIAQASGARPSFFDPKAKEFVGVELLSLMAKMVDRIPRGEDGTRQKMGQAVQGGQYDKAWAQAAIRQGHPDYEALTNSKHPRHAELTQLRNQAYALG